ncbi:MAG TPA: hypothetical protein VFD59_05080 [Nocardioidaceae bacterium]|nr:hypothetical protein [Nocardioidaceae bacterium]
MSAGSRAFAASSTSLESASERPELQVFGWLRSMVRTVRAARGLLTYVGRVIGNGSQSEPACAPGASITASAAVVACSGRCSGSIGRVVSTSRGVCGRP